MLSRNEIIEKLKNVLVEMDPKNAQKVENVTDNTKLLTDLGIDSVSMLYLVIAVEETFDIYFDSDEQFVTVGQVVDYIQSKLQ